MVNLLSDVFSRFEQSTSMMYTLRRTYIVILSCVPWRANRTKANFANQCLSTILLIITMFTGEFWFAKFNRFFVRCPFRNARKSDRMSSYGCTSCWYLSNAEKTQTFYHEKHLEISSYGNKASENSFDDNSLSVKFYII